MNIAKFISLLLCSGMVLLLVSCGGGAIAYDNDSGDVDLDKQDYGAEVRIVCRAAGDSLLGDCSVLIEFYDTLSGQKGEGVFGCTLTGSYCEIYSGYRAGLVLNFNDASGNDFPLESTHISNISFEEIVPSDNHEAQEAAFPATLVSSLISSEKADNSIVSAEVTVNYQPQTSSFPDLSEASPSASPASPPVDSPSILSPAPRIPPGATPALPTEPARPIAECKDDSNCSTKPCDGIHQPGDT
ncbi:MAG TPA: hypothetical protein PLP17_14255, partial [Oligoflexia bacterium]|nr:hypothetical protein [Oligoflexia bacterium]